MKRTRQNESMKKIATGTKTHLNIKFQFTKIVIIYLVLINKRRVTYKFGQNKLVFN